MSINTSIITEETTKDVTARARKNFESFSAWVEEACRERLTREEKREQEE